MSKPSKCKLAYSDRLLSVNMVYRKKHNSTTLLQKNINQLVAIQIIDNLISTLFLDQLQKDRIVQLQIKQLKCLEGFDIFYNLLQSQKQQQILSIMDEEPLPQSKSGKQGACRLTKKIKKRVKNEDEFGLMKLMEERESRFVQKDKKSKEKLIVGLKRQYSAILQSKYISQSRILEGHEVQKGEDDEQIKLLRMIYQKQMKMKLKLKIHHHSNRQDSLSNRSDIYHQKISEKNQLNQNQKYNSSRYKLNKMDQFMDININNIDEYLNSRRSSLIDGFHIPLGQLVTAKVSKLQDVKNVVATEKLKIKYAADPSEPIPLVRASTITILHANDRQNYHRQQINKIVQTSYIQMNGGRLKQSNDKEGRVSQSFCVMLPKINRKRLQ